MESRMKRRSWLDALLTLALVPAAPIAGHGEGQSRVLAEIDGQRILAADLQAALAAERRRDAARNRLDSFASAAKGKVLGKMIDTKLLALAARAEKLDQRPEVKRAIENLVDESLAEAMRAEQARKAPLDEATLRSYYAAHPEQFQVPGRVRARHVVVRTQAEAVSIHGRLRRNADFVALAREHNGDSTKATGGDLGWVQRGVMVPEFEKVLFALKVREISPIVQTPYGFHIIQVEEIEPPKPKAFESVTAEIKRSIVEHELDAFRARLATKHAVKIHAAVLKSVR